jgi:hypothetical protein
MTLSTQQSASRLTAKLDRAPRDVLEAAVVLEAWGGLAPESALIAATVSGGSPTPERRPSRPPAALDRNRHELVAQVVGLIVVAVWLFRARDEIGSPPVRHGWLVALPLVLGVEWALRRRYVGGRDGIGRTHRDRFVLAGAVLGVGIVGVALVPVARAGAIGTAVFVALVSGLLLSWRRWTAAYGTVMMAALACTTRIDVLWVIAVTALILAVTAACALVSAAAAPYGPRPWRGVVAAATTGFALGGLMVLAFLASGSISEGIPVGAFVPALVGSAWAGLHLAQLWVRIPWALEDVDVVAVAGERVGAAAGRGAAWRVLFGALVRLLVPASVLTVAYLYFVADEPADGTLLDLQVVLIVIAAVGLVVGVFDAFNYQAAGLVTLLTCVAVTAAMVLLLGTVVIAICVGAGVAGVVAIFPARELLRDPARTFAQFR